MINQFKAIYRKELKDTLRDKRALLMIAYFVFGTPIFAVVVFYLIALFDDDRRSHLEVSGIEHAPGLVAFVEKQGIDVAPTELIEQLPTELAEGTDGILVIPKDYTARMAKGQVIPLKLFVQETNSESIRRSAELQAAIARFGGHIASVRLLARGVPTSLVRPITIASIDISENNFLNKFMSEFLLLILIIAPFAAGMSIAIDVLAGERERSSLQPLLAQPASSTTLALGKWALVASFGAIATVLTLMLLVVEFRFLPFDFLTIRPNIHPLNLLLIISQLIPLAMLVAAVQMFFSINAKSFKEAQTVLSMVMLVPFFAGYMKVLIGDRLPDIVHYLPILSNMESVGRLLYQGEPSIPHIAAALFVNLLGCALMIYLTVRRLESEKLLDGN